MVFAINKVRLNFSSFARLFQEVNVSSLYVPHCPYFKTRKLTLSIVGDLTDLC